MKNLNIFSIGIISLFILSLFTSCDKEEFDTIIPISETMTNPDTSVIVEGLVFKIGESEVTNFNGISVTCPNADPNLDKFINIIAYGTDLEVSADGQVVTFEDDLFIFYWETVEEISAGTYQALVSIEEDYAARETIAEVSITEVTNSFISGTFKGKLLDDDERGVMNFSGSFSVSRYDCTLFGDDIPSSNDFDTSLTFGQTKLEFGTNNQEDLRSIYLNCTGVFSELDGDKHIQILAEAVFVQDDEIDDIILPRYFTYHREMEELELDREYQGRFGIIENDEDPFETDESFVLNISRPITIVYTDGDGDFIIGRYTGQHNGEELNGTFRSQIFECD